MTSVRIVPGSSGTVDPLANPLRPLQQQLRSGIILQRQQQPCEALERPGDQHVIWTKCGFSNGQRPLEQRSGCGRIASQCALNAKIEQARRQIRVSGTKQAFSDRDRALGDRYASPLPSLWMNGGPPDPAGRERRRLPGHRGPRRFQLEPATLARCFRLRYPSRDRRALGWSFRRVGKPGDRRGALDSRTVCEVKTEGLALTRATANPMIRRRARASRMRQVAVSADRVTSRT